MMNKAERLEGIKKLAEGNLVIDYYLKQVEKGKEAWEDVMEILVVCLGKDNALLKETIEEFSRRLGE